jgi:hypothetical protein
VLLRLQQREGRWGGCPERTAAQGMALLGMCMCIRIAGWGFWLALGAPVLFGKVQAAAAVLMCAWRDEALPAMQGCSS